MHGIEANQTLKQSVGLWLENNKGLELIMNRKLLTGLFGVSGVNLAFVSVPNF